MLEIDASAVMSGTYIILFTFKAFYDLIVQMLGIKQYLADDVTLGRLITSIHFLFVNTSDSEHAQPAFTRSKLTIETLEQGVKHSKLTIKIPERRH